MTEDIPINEGKPVIILDPISIIENQIMIINEVNDWNLPLYDTFDEDRIKVVSNAFKLIAKAQKKMMHEL